MGTTAEIVVFNMEWRAQTLGLRKDSRLSLGFAIDAQWIGLGCELARRTHGFFRDLRPLFLLRARPLNLQGASFQVPDGDDWGERFIVWSSVLSPSSSACEGKIS